MGGSLPARERGLKLIPHRVTIALVDVAPRAGAWIETFCGICICWIVKSLPARERGFKRMGMST